MIYKDTVEQELERNERLIGIKPITDSLKSFATDLKIQEGLTDHRIIFYLIRLRVLSKMMPDVFLNPSMEDLKSAIVNLQSKANISPRTVEDYKQAIRKYYKWKLSDREFQKRVQWIKVRGNSVNRLKKSEEMVTVEEMHKLVENCISVRDKALFSLLYDSGCRVGEILTLRIRDLQNDQWGTVLHVSGKTGERMVRIVGDSVPYLREWVQQHPKANNPDSMVFVSTSAQAYSEPMNYPEMARALNRAKRRAGITRRIHPHLFRHTRASILASRVAEAPLESQMGWIHGSRQTRTYVHLSAKDQDMAILKAYGIKPEEDNVVKDISPRECPRCNTLNPSNAVYCRKCWLPLTIEATLELKVKEEHIERELENKGLIDERVKALIENMPESERTGILTAIIQIALTQKDKKIIGNH
jgi:integrase/ribosomal protein L40E